jgi:hypothetical protein
MFLFGLVLVVAVTLKEVLAEWSMLTLAIAALVGVAAMSGACSYAEGTLRRPRLAAGDIASTGGSEGVVIPIHRRVDTWMIVSFSSAVVAQVIGSILATGGWRAFWMIMASLCAALTAPLVRTWPMSHQLVLTVDGVFVQDGTQSSYLAWDDIIMILWWSGGRMDKVYAIEGAADAPSWWCERRSWYHRPKHVRMVVPTLYIDLDPLLLGWALMTYWKKPDLRSELATGVARSRLLDPEFAYAATPSTISMMPPFSLYRPRWSA